MIYQKEIKKAIMWLFETQNRENFGWSWVRDISPNEQNTAEVVYATTLFSEILSDNQKQLINEAVRKWLLLPSTHAVLTIDWAWVGMALSKYAEHYEEYAPDFSIAFVRLTRAEGWGVSCLGNCTLAGLGASWAQLTARLAPLF